jgi:hypothetical protein
MLFSNTSQLMACLNPQSLSCYPQHLGNVREKGLQSLNFVRSYKTHALSAALTNTVMRLRVDVVANGESSGQEFMRGAKPCNKNPDPELLQLK